MEIAEYIYEGAVEPSYKKLIGQMLTVLVLAGKWDNNMPCQILTPRSVRALESA